MGFDRAPIPTHEEMDFADQMGREIVAYSAVTRGRLLFLRLVFRTGDSGVLCMDPIRGDYFLRTLKRFLPNGGENEGSPQQWEAEGLEEVRGNLPGK